MLGGLTSLRNYLIISAVVAIVLYITQMIAGQTFADALTSLNYTARGAGMAPVIADAVTEPIRAVILPNNLLGAIAGGLLWPVLLLWILLSFALFFFAILGRGLGTAGRAITN